MRLNSPQINLIIKACMKASRSLIRDFGEIENLQVSTKSPGDFVSSADKRTEKIIVNELLTLKEKGTVNKIGISIYSPEILEELSKKIKLDIVQAPFNIFDRQLLLSGWSDKLKESGVEIHTRSVFLQGLLLMKRSILPKYFTKNWPDLFRSWYDFLSKNSANAQVVALKFALTQSWIDKIVVGVDSGSQLKALVEIEKSSLSLDFPRLGCDDANLINPSKWDLE